MKKLKTNAKRVYIVMTHTKQPQPDGTTKVIEKCEFVDSLKNRHYSSATVILDFLEEKIIKNRENTGTYAQYNWYLHQNYPQQMGELVNEYKK